MQGTEFADSGNKKASAMHSLENMVILSCNDIHNRCEMQEKTSGGLIVLENIIAKSSPAVILLEY